MLKAKNTITVVLPIRAGSQRVVGKNIRPFGDFRYGLTELKLRQLLLVEEFDEILVDTDIAEIAFIVELLISEKIDISRLRIEKRNPKLASGDTTTDSLIEYLAPKIETTDVFWTHTTQPFISPSIIRSSLKRYFEILNEGFDSLMSVTALQTFIWDENKAINYSPKIEKWPRTQTLPKLYCINSGIFINSAKDMMARSDRIGLRPFLFEVDKLCGWDIDDRVDFDLANSFATTLMKDKLLK